MRKIFALFTTLLAVSCSALEKPKLSIDYGADQWSSVRLASQSGDCSRAQIVASKIEVEQSGASNNENRQPALQALFDCAHEKKQRDITLYALQRLTFTTDQERLRLIAIAANAADLKLSGVGARAIEELASKYPGATASLDPALINFTDQLIDKSDSEARISFLQTLRSDASPHSMPAKRLDYINFTLAQLFLEKSDTENAADSLRRLISPDYLLTAYLDSDFDEVRQLVPALTSLNLEGALNSLDAYTAERLETNPVTLESLEDRLWSLRFQQSLDDAIALGTAALTKLSNDPEAYPDFEFSMSWMLKEFSYSLFESGRVEDAINIMRAASGLPENGGENISHKLELARMLEAVGRPLDALAIVDHQIKDASEHGDLDRRSIRACALSQLGRTAEAEKESRRLKRSALKNYHAAMRAEFCLGRTEEMKQLLIKRLTDRKLEIGAIFEIAKYTADRRYRTLRQIEYDRTIDELRRDPGVKKALRPDAAVLEIPFPNLDWGDY